MKYSETTAWTPACRSARASGVSTDAAEVAEDIEEARDADDACRSTGVGSAARGLRDAVPDTAGPKGRSGWNGLSGSEEDAEDSAGKLTGGVTGCGVAGAG
ncbi:MULTISPECIES: hypothetical protein [Pandoraea]|uniref:hypothetical protein n=1 Tax=Pandoraea TaxID=93217 RepID=UPI001F5DD024|nr:MULTISPECIES: hypothetical protein [Pandoraea]MCI3208740.1 hypothetical protein [Pandoraea sp. LA3]MDN4586769.1 hypothetical protein [Pandoraea capi]